jgi:hypothetical protein
MAGLLAGHFFRQQRPLIWEAQASLPNNHAALLRFRTDAVSRVTGIPFRRVNVTKAVLNRELKLMPLATMADSNAYSLKVSGEARARSILDLRPVERYIAPEDFIQQLANGLSTIPFYNQPVTATDLKMIPGQHVISTLPMPVLLKLAGEEVPDGMFGIKPIWSVTTTLREPICDLYQTLYGPWDHVSWYRASFTGARLILEFPGEPLKPRAEIDFLLSLLGFKLETCIYEPPILKKQPYGKLLPCADESLRRSTILSMTDRFGLYSLGRFATWRQILLDDVVHDCEVIQRMITDRDRYGRHLHQSGPLDRAHSPIP